MDRPPSDARHGSWVRVTKGLAGARVAAEVRALIAGFGLEAVLTAGYNAHKDVIRVGGAGQPEVPEGLRHGVDYPVEPDPTARITGDLHAYARRRHGGTR